MEQDSDAEMPSAGPSGGKVCEKKRFEVKKWNAVALWAWDIVVDNCAICRNHIMDLCIECQANQVSLNNNKLMKDWSTWGAPGRWAAAGRAARPGGPGE